MGLRTRWTSDEERREVLQQLLAACRKRLAPRDIGMLDSGGHQSVTQEQVAQCLHMSARHYGSLERGRIHQPDLALLDSLATLLKMSSTERTVLMHCALRLPPPPVLPSYLDGTTGHSSAPVAA